jgi:hypothetical protein
MGSCCGSKRADLRGLFEDVEEHAVDASKRLRCRLLGADAVGRWRRFGTPAAVQREIRSVRATPAGASSSVGLLVRPS